MTKANAPTTAAQPSPLMSAQQVAELFGRTPRTIRNWVVAGHLRPRRIGGAVFFLRSEVDQMLDLDRPDDADVG